MSGPVIKTKSKIESNVTELLGVVLAGGFSVRMKRDKSAIEYHGIPQWLQAVQMLKSTCSNVAISCREAQREQFLNQDVNIVCDKISGLGPMAGIVEVFKTFPNRAFMILATDLPFVTSEDLLFLRNERNSAKSATCFVNPENNLPEPMVSIWEPHAYAQILGLVSRGITCPRKILLNLDVKLVVPPNLDAIINVNTPDECDKALRFFGNHKFNLNQMEQVL